MDLNLAYAAHQQALMRADVANDDTARAASLVEASAISERIGAFQQMLGAAAACAWVAAQLDMSAQA